MAAVPAEYVRNRFFRGFIVALARAGVERIEAANDIHQRLFAHVARQLGEKLLVEWASDEYVLPLYFPRNPITGYFTDFDEALIDLRHSLVSVADPYQPSMRITASPELIEAIGKQFSNAENEALNQLAATYAAARKASAEAQYA